jgi:hypothetical protein
LWGADVTRDVALRFAKEKLFIAAYQLKEPLCSLSLLRIASAEAAAGPLAAALRVVVEDLWVVSFDVRFEDIGRNEWERVMNRVGSGLDVMFVRRMDGLNTTMNGGTAGVHEWRRA